MIMEVETRIPIGPAPRPFSEGPSYSPITPERGSTPDQRRDGLQEAAQMQHKKETLNEQDVIQGGALSGPALSLAEKLRLSDGGFDNATGFPPLGPNAFASPSLITGNGRRFSLQETSVNFNPFPQGNPAFQGFDGVDADDTDPILPPLVDDSAFMESAASVQDSEPNRIRAFAKLEFDDGQFYMNTYAIEIGRDRDAARQAEQRRVQEHDRKESEGRRSRDGSNPDLEKAQRIPDAGMSAAASVISGGIMHMGDGEERTRKKKKRSKSAGSSSKGLNFRDSLKRNNGTTDYQALANASLLDQYPARPVDLTNMMPSPDECPLIPIHPPPTTEGGLTGHKGISRKHVRIAFNHEKGLFELHVLGKNGCFIDGAHMEKGEVVALASGTDIQIGGVSVRFVLPNVPDGETGTDLRSDAVSQSAMSFDFEDGRGESAIGDQDSESPTTDNEDDRYRELRLAQKAEALMSDDDEDDEDADDADEMEVDVRRSRPKIMLKISGLSSKGKSKPVQDEEPPPKRKVGRPPKNGIMSKREEAELRRKEKEAAKAKGKEKKKKQAEEVAEMRPIKKEVEPQDELPPSPIDRKKAKKKKPEEPAEESSNVIESIEKEQGETPVEPTPAPAPKPSKKERPAKPPRSPSPVFNEAELTPEQLAKPSQSYVVLIHEALSNHPEGRMSLPQIYRAIERKYPYYKLRVQTVGWQSSVRHNLSQHPAFVKIERDGKGWMWGLDPNVSIEREKKRRPSPPPIQAPGWNAPGSNTFNRQFPQNSFTGANGQMPQNPYAMFPTGQAPLHQQQQQPPPPGRGFPPPAQFPTSPFSGSQQPNSTPATYQSPYGTNRPPGQAAADSSHAGQQQQQPANGVPQMPAPYLNQSRPAQNGTQGQPQQAGIQAGVQAPRPGFASGSQTSPMAATAARPVQSPGQAGLQQARPQSQASSAFSPPPNNPYGIPPHVWGAIERFRSALKQAMAAIPDGEAMVNQAINKCIGLREQYKVFPKENSVMIPLKGMLAKFSWPAEAMIAYAEGKTATRPLLSGPAPAPAPAASVAAPSKPSSAQSPVGSTPPRPHSGSALPNPPPPLPPQYQAPPPQTRPSQSAPQSTPQSTTQQQLPKPTEPAQGTSVTSAVGSSQVATPRPTVGTPSSAPMATSVSAAGPAGATPSTVSVPAVAQQSQQPGQQPGQDQVTAQNQQQAQQPATSTENGQDSNLKRSRPSEALNAELGGTSGEGEGEGSKSDEPPAKKMAQG